MTTQPEALRVADTLEFAAPTNQTIDSAVYELRRLHAENEQLNAEREKCRWDIHSCHPNCERYACVATRKAVQVEREECAKVCDKADKSTHPADLANAIRAREKA